MAQDGNQLTCKLEFDGKCRGNRAGAGAVLRNANGRKLCRLRRGLGNRTKTVAIYKGLIIGLTYAVQRGYKHISVQGDSELVVMQVRGSFDFQVNDPNLVPLYNEVIILKDLFDSFTIDLVPYQYNTKADHEAKMAINLDEGESAVLFN